MKNQLLGAEYLFEGLKLIAKPGLRRFVVIPVLLNVLIFTGLFWLAIHYWQEFTQWISAYLPHWLQWLQWLLWIAFFLLGIIILFYTFTTIANLIAAPFNNLLAEKVELYLTGTVSPSAEGVWGAIKSIPSAFGRQFRLISYYLLRAGLLLILSLLPMIHPIATIAWFVFTAWMAALQYLDYPMDNHRISVKQMREHVSQKRLMTLGFGGTVMLFTMIPIVNFFIMPAAVAGATAFWVEQFK